jgi:antitoxin component of MazEF toxin-antitoxin module
LEKLFVCYDIWQSAVNLAIFSTSLNELDKVMIPYFSPIAMLAKITSKNQLTLPKSVTQAVGATEYFDVEARAGQIILTPVRIHRGDAVRAKLAELDLTDDDMAATVAWARTPQAAPAMAAEPVAAYALKPAKPKKAAKKAQSKA